MPHFYFHLSTNGHMEHDLDGVPFANLEAARLDAETRLFEMASEALARGNAPDVSAIEIADEQGVLLATVKIEVQTEATPARKH